MEKRRDSSPQDGRPLKDGTSLNCGSSRSSFARFALLCQLKKIVHQDRQLLLGQLARWRHRLPSGPRHTATNGRLDLASLSRCQESRIEKWRWRVHRGRRDAITLAGGSVTDCTVDRKEIGAGASLLRGRWRAQTAAPKHGRKAKQDGAFHGVTLMIDESAGLFDLEPDAATEDLREQVAALFHSIRSRIA